MKVNHELPLNLLHMSREISDYDFVLPHLLDEYPIYANWMADLKAEGRYMIMDNSIHELGEAYNFDRLKHWVYKLKPNEFIVPDVWEDTNATLAQAKHWMSWYKDNIDQLEETELIAVVQAKSYSEAINCYILLKEMGYKKIAFSYGAQYYADIVGHPNKTLSKALGRIQVITSLINDEIIEENDRVHLLGCSCPFEFAAYQGINQIETIDTSNPVMLGIEEKEYNFSLTNSKPLANLNSHFDSKLTLSQIDCIMRNVKKFRNFLGV